MPRSKVFGLHYYFIYKHTHPFVITSLLSMTMVGVMNMSISETVSSSSTFWNNQPRIGMSDKKGTFFSVSVLVFSKIPPSTVVAPFATTTSDVASFVVIVGLPLPSVLAKSAAFFVAWIWRNTWSSVVTCGVTVRLSSASINCVAVPSCEVVSYGILLPL